MNSPKKHPRYDKTTKFAYSRPDFLQLKTHDEILVSADHLIRPIILPRDSTRLPWFTGYAECINAGKSPKNEDQAASFQDVIVRKSSILEAKIDPSRSIQIDDQLPWFYFGIFDGHAGPAVAVTAAAQLHDIISAKLNQISDLLFILGLNKETTRVSSLSTVNEQKEKRSEQQDNADKNGDCHGDDDNDDDDNLDDGDSDSEDGLRFTSSDEEINDDRHAEMTPKPDLLSLDCDTSMSLPNLIDFYRHEINVDSLIKGVLESAFWEMDAIIGHDKQNYQMAGGCTAIVSVFILGKLYVCNAGDSRAIIAKRLKDQPNNNNQGQASVIEMSHDFTPTTERHRLLKMGMQRPHLLGNEYTHLQFPRRPTRKDLGKQMLYKDAYMTGWSMKTITYDDLKVPLVWGEGKRSRLLATIGVTRGFGDHELKATYGGLPIKPFLTCEPEVRIYSLEDDTTLTSDDVLIMGTDGLWDNVSNLEAAHIVQESFNHFSQGEDARSKYRFVTAAQDLVIHSRGYSSAWKACWRTEDGFMASPDDISVFVIPLEKYRNDYLEWKELRKQARSRRFTSSQSSHQIRSLNNEPQTTNGAKGKKNKNKKVESIVNKSDSLGTNDIAKEYHDDQENGIPKVNSDDNNKDCQHDLTKSSGSSKMDVSSEELTGNQPVDKSTSHELAQSKATK